MIGVKLWSSSTVTEYFSPLDLGIYTVGGVGGMESIDFVVW